MCPISFFYRCAFSFLCSMILSLGIRSAWAEEPAATPIPRLVTDDASSHLEVDGKPFLILGGELHNSTASDLEATAPLFPELKKMGLNTVIAPVYWELLEPEEGKFDFTLVDGLLKQAREQGQRLILLWFGTYKNGSSTYPPPWVMAHPERFPHSERDKGTPMFDHLSVFSAATLDADRTAFVALLRHLQEVDGTQHTVIFIQVENEIGIFAKRDQSAQARQLFNREVPHELLDYLAMHRSTLLPETQAIWGQKGNLSEGTWSGVFGDSASEVFMAWYFGRFVEALASAGKAEYAVPMYVNCWIKQDDKDTAGAYPCGGPVPPMHDIWRAAAPSLDCLGIDIYKPDFKTNANLWIRSGNPLFIPEVECNSFIVPKALYAFGSCHAICFSPFGIEDAAGRGIVEPLYTALASIQDMILANVSTGKLHGMMLGGDEKEAQVDVGGCILKISGTPGGDSSLLSVELSPGKILLLANDTKIQALNKADPKSPLFEASFSSGTYRDGNWVSDGSPPSAGSVSMTNLQFFLLKLPNSP